MIKKILVIIGTWSEAIKMALLINMIKKDSDFDLDIMKESQDLFEISSNILLQMKEVFNVYTPDLVSHREFKTLRLEKKVLDFCGALNG